MSLEIQNIKKDFVIDNQEVFSALKGVSLKINNGEFLTLLGPSGCGKTTLLRIIAGFEKPSCGGIYFKGSNITELPVHKRNFPMVFQSYALFPHMTVSENIAYGLKMKKVISETINSKVQKIVDLTGLGPNKDKYPHQMSGGQQQRVALARALVMEPELMLFDEPLSNLDANLRISMRNEIRSIQRELKITVVYVTHDQEEAMAVSDKIVVMNAGQIEQIGSPQEIYAKPSTEFVANFVGKANIIKAQSKGDRVSILGQDYALASAYTNVSRAVVRPESMEIREDGLHSGKVLSATYLGSHWIVELETGSEKVFVTAPHHLNGVSIEQGELVRFGFDQKVLHYLTSASDC